MSTPNNLHGHTSNIEWKEVYKEELEKGLYIVISRSYEDVYKSPHFASSSHVCIKAVVTDGTFHAWSNGVLSWRGEDIFQDETVPLRKLTSKEGWLVIQHRVSKDRVIWIVEVPMQILIKFSSIN